MAQREPITWQTLDADFRFLQALANKNVPAFYRYRHSIENEFAIWTQILNAHTNKEIVLLPEFMQIVLNESSRSKINIDFIEALDPCTQIRETNNSVDEEFIFQIDDL